jgi:hypothetical protein
MGFLDIRGRVLFYSEYKNNVEEYKVQGLQQFINIFKSHAHRKLESKNLHWGEEIEYTLFYFD